MVATLLLLGTYLLHTSRRRGLDRRARGDHVLREWREPPARHQRLLLVLTAVCAISATIDTVLRLVGH